MGKIKRTQKNIQLITVSILLATGLTACTSEAGPNDTSNSVSSNSSASAENSAVTETLFKYQSKHLSSNSSSIIIAQKTGTESAVVPLDAKSGKPIEVSVTFNCFGTGSVKIKTSSGADEFTDGNCVPEENLMPALYDVKFKTALDPASSNINIVTSGQVTYFVTVSKK